jgi:hypothetical protein
MFIASGSGEFEGGLEGGLKGFAPPPHPQRRASVKTSKMLGKFFMDWSPMIDVRS